jgi:opacity protein-like surface antigen
MTKLFLSGVALVALAAADVAHAADMLPLRAKAPAQIWNWTGGYVGVHVGAAWGTTNFSDPFGSSLYGDRVRTPAFLGGGQIGYNWQAATSPWVFGLEADISGLVSDGTHTCLAFSGFFVSANCRVRPDATTTLTGRIGYAIGPQGRTLLYLKGGLAGVHDHIDLATNAILPPQATSANVWKWGGTAGAGVEHALTPAWSLKLEYDYLGFGGRSVATPVSLLQVAPPSPTAYVTTASNASNVTQNLHQVKLGLNYRLGMDPWTGWPTASPSYPVKAVHKSPPRAAWAPGWDVEAGARYWLSFGRFQKDLGSGTTPATANVLNSRLIYDTTANSGEFFGRVETPQNIFVKGFVGGGKLASGKLNDEDWGLGGGVVPYSNTISDPVTGKISYATVDVGWDVFRAPDHKLGAFAGYNYYREDKAAYGCVQIANQFSDCVPSIPSSVLGITEDDTWRSLRVGLNGEIMLLDGLRLSGDVAYLPYVKFDGTDNHVLRNLVSPEWGRGRGVQLEAILSYDVTPAFNIGAGGRYWAMWTTEAYTSFGGAPCPCQTLPSKTERYGMFLQASYKFGAPVAVIAKY